MCSAMCETRSLARTTATTATTTLLSIFAVAAAGTAFVGSCGELLSLTLVGNKMSEKCMSTCSEMGQASNELDVVGGMYAMASMENACIRNSPFA